MRSQQITPREKQVDELVTMGMTSKEVSVRLGIKLYTVYTHRQRIRLKKRKLL